MFKKTKQENTGKENWIRLFAAGRVLWKFGRFTKALADVTTRLIDYSASLFISACVQSWKNGHFTKVKKKKSNQKRIKNPFLIANKSMEITQWNWTFSRSLICRESLYDAMSNRSKNKKDELPNQIKMAKNEKVWPPSRISSSLLLLVSAKWKIKSKRAKNRKKIKKRWHNVLCPAWWITWQFLSRCLSLLLILFLQRRHMHIMSFIFYSSRPSRLSS